MTETSRRTLLTLIGAAAAGPVAGCLGKQATEEALPDYIRNNHELTESTQKEQLRYRIRTPEYHLREVVDIPSLSTGAGAIEGDPSDPDSVDLYTEIMTLEGEDYESLEDFTTSPRPRVWNQIEHSMFPLIHGAFAIYADNEPPNGENIPAYRDVMGDMEFLIHGHDGYAASTVLDGWDVQETEEVYRRHGWSLATANHIVALIKDNTRHGTYRSLQG